MTRIDIPDFGSLLAPYIGAIPEASQPAFLSRLERTAAERYRGWAIQLPEHKAGLLACAEREDEIATRVETVLPASSAEHTDLINQYIEPARDTYYQVFSALPVIDQLAIQANAERQGARAWRDIADQLEDPHIIEELLLCASIEEASADYLDKLIAAE
ncbi:hypothetical protein [Oceanicoccus sagamiensis]|uniref:Uncharacterized protein n=1 Tax=Oceanicoccus sagamiensis TaxID=716816 RepID=A0A1X9ND94_9GAMM|nr:hypothetical protein [Oceanicoccus sagamiensis]ARN72927.1 hypothetical protein BST96_01685 [Oceanicoccus sagamiensis]